MEHETLVRMANQIAAFFRAYPEQEARAGIRDHIEAFWTPKMRQMLTAETAGLDPLAARALRREVVADSPVEKGTESGGAMASDAG